VASDLRASKETAGIRKNDVKPALTYLASASFTMFAHCYQPATDRERKTQIVVAQPSPFDFSYVNTINVFSNDIAQGQIIGVGGGWTPRLDDVSTLKQTTHMVEKSPLPSAARKVVPDGNLHRRIILIVAPLTAEAAARERFRH
jgi:hypothetical protein